MHTHSFVDHPKCITPTLSLLFIDYFQPSGPINRAVLNYGYEMCSIRPNVQKKGQFCVRRKLSFAVVLYMVVAYNILGNICH